MGKSTVRAGLLGALCALIAGFSSAWAADEPEMAFVFGHTGEVRFVNNKAFLDFGGVPTEVLDASGMTCNLFFEDVRLDTNQGFDDPTDGPAARQRIRDVLVYLGDTLNETGTIDILFNLSNNNGTAALASAGTLYFNSNGFNNPTSLFRLKNGSKPAAAFPEILVTVDFGYNYNLTTAPTVIGQFDFFTVLLHEFTHGLGFASTTNPDGTSQLGGNARTKFDQHLVKGQGGANIFAPAFSGTAADFKSNDVFFEGPNAVTAYDQAGVQPGIFAPNAADPLDFWFGIDNDQVEGEGEEVNDGFAQGSSISHWNTFQIVGGAVMEHALTSGVDIRTYAPVDVGGLVDIGWTLAELPPVPEGEGVVDGEGEGEGVVDGEGEGSVEGEGEGIVDGEGEGVVDGEGAIEGEGEGIVDGEGEGEGLVDGEGEGSVDGEGEGSVEGEGEGTVDGEGEGTADGEGEVTLTATLEATADATLYESETGNLANGAGERLFTGISDDEVARRALLFFDVESVIPSGSEIVSARLLLNLSKKPTGDAASFIDVHRVSQFWTEGPSNPSGQEGLPATAQSGDATWLHRTFNTVSWTTPGGDFAAGASASQAVDAEGPVVVESQGLALDVQDWLDAPAANHGWILLGDEAGQRNARRFDSRENAAAGNRPQLEIEYIPGTGEGEGDGDGEGEGEGEGAVEGEGEGSEDGEGDVNAIAVLLVFGTIDTSEDGTISLEEFEAGGFFAAEFELFDTNNDNILTVAELLDAAGGGIIHTGDTDGDGAFGLDELLRIIQFFNSAGYTCAATPGASEDGYEPQAGGIAGCVRHTSDFLAPAGRITLSELLRAIQFFNVGGIEFCDGIGEDDFCPVAAG